ncbi:hypothetical protein [Streptomyces sp. TS71-3]|uniref:hypothetical protein n=1 Tax=Streptomyces sp. TS71-3 TaxID=2733862 RepID=UPI0035AC1F4F
MGAQPPAETAADAPDGTDEDAPAAQHGGAENDGAKQPAATPDEPAFDEEAAWAAIVAGYGEEPPDPPGAKPFKPIENLLLPEPGPSQGTPGGTTRRRGPERTPETGADGTDGSDGAESRKSGKDGTKDGSGEKGDKFPRAGRALGGSVAFAPGVGPRDYRTADPADDDFDGDDEGHFVPPEPPPLPTGDTTARFGWLAVLGGPLLLLLSVLLGWEMTWWLATLGIGGFVGGFITLVVRMNPGDEDNDDPGRGAVV